MATSRGHFEVKQLQEIPGRKRPSVYFPIAEAAWIVKALFRDGRPTSSETLFIITSMKYSEQMIHWSSFSSTSFRWLRISSFCACTFSFSSCKKTHNPICYSGEPTRMHNRTGSRVNHLEWDSGVLFTLAQHQRKNTFHKGDYFSELLSNMGYCLPFFLLSAFSVYTIFCLLPKINQMRKTEGRILIPPTTQNQNEA